MLTDPDVRDTNMPAQQLQVRVRPHAKKCLLTYFRDTSRHDTHVLDRLPFRCPKKFQRHVITNDTVNETMRDMYIMLSKFLGKTLRQTAHTMLACCKPCR